MYENPPFPPFATYEYTIHSWDLDDRTPNPLRGFDRGVIYVGLRGKDGTNGTIFTRALYSFQAPCILSSSTVGELLSCYSRYQFTPPLSSNLQTQQVDFADNNCVGMFYKRGNDTPRNGVLLPGSVCGLVPAPIGSCSMSTSLEFDHGAGSATNLDGNRSERPLIIDCNSAMSAKITAGHDVVSLTTGLNSTLRLNGQTLDKKGVGINLRIGQNVLDLSSTLRATSNVNAGVYNGNTYLVLSLP